MKVIKTASGKTKIKMSRAEWTNLGKKAGWMKEAEGDSPHTDKENPRTGGAPSEWGDVVNAEWEGENEKGVGVNWVTYENGTKEYVSE